LITILKKEENLTNEKKKKKKKEKKREKSKARAIKISVQRKATVTSF